MKRLFYFAICVSSTASAAINAPIVSHAWTTANAKAKDLVSKMTLFEMNNITIGYSAGEGALAAANTCSGISGAVPRLGYPGMCFQDAENGVRGQDGVSAFASGVSVGASWNIDLAFDRGLHIGAEFKRKGANIALGPVVGPIGRVAKGGRNWEGFAADPYLEGQLVIPTVRGMQKSVIACTKHFILFEQAGYMNLINQSALALSSNVDDKTMHELYLWPFDDAVYAGTGSIMCSYNRINGTYACENNAAQNDLLKGELNFPGFIVTDWGASYSGIPAAANGLDVVMPSSSSWSQGQLALAVQNGSLSRERLEDMATRTLTTWYLLNQDSSTPEPGAGLTSNLSRPHRFINARDPASAPNIFQQAQEGHVLVKNVNNALPLKKPDVLSIFGYDAIAPAVGGPDNVDGSLLRVPTFDLSLLNWASIGLSGLVGGILGLGVPNTVNGTLWTGGGSGANTPPYLSTPFEAVQQRAIADGTQLFWNFASYDPNVEAASDACLVFINQYASETFDRGSLSDVASDTLVKNVADNCANTIVIIHNAGIRVVDAWIEHENVTAVMYAHLPGQDTGRALASLVYGDVSPSGRLPYTVAKREEDYGTLLGPCLTGNIPNPQCEFEEGVNIDYRSFLARNITPRFEFGFGLTYSEFSYSNLSIHLNSSVETYSVDDFTRQNSLFEIVASISATITNTGKWQAAEVAQLYIQLPTAETRALRGFTKAMLRPGESKQVTFPLREKDISSWDTVSQEWVRLQGTYQVAVGASVLDIKLSDSFTL